MEAIHLILFSRAPVAGQTKTRLAATIGPEAACRLHAHCLNDLIAVCAAFSAANGMASNPAAATGAAVICHLFLTPPGSETVFANAGVEVPASFRIHAQQGEDLGARMAGAFAEVLGAAGPGARALLFGSDLPLLDGSHLEQALAALDGADVVLGPTEDGGYYLVGMKAPQPALFDLAAWGGGEVLAATEERAREAGLATARIDTLPDLDTEADLARVRAHPLFRELSGRHACRYIAALAP